MHVPGEEQVPPLEHTGVQTATTSTKYNEQLAGNTFQQAVLLRISSKDFSFFHIPIQMCQYLRVAHLEPVHSAVHVHVPGEEQTPPLEHTGVQTAKT